MVGAINLANRGYSRANEEGLTREYVIGTEMCKAHTVEVCSMQCNAATFCKLLQGKVVSQYQGFVQWNPVRVDCVTIFCANISFMTTAKLHKAN